MKRWILMLFALMMAVCMAVPVLAEPVADMVSVDLSKVYTLTNAGTENQAETFTFTIEKVKVEDSSFYTLETMPMFENQTYTIDFAQGEATVEGDKNSVSLDLPVYEHVGVFTYKITESVGSTAGVSYDSSPMYLKVTVIEQNGKVRVAALHYQTEDGDKTECFENVYAAGSLAISKTVTGNMGEKDRYFTVTVTLTGQENKTYAQSYPVTGGSNENNPSEIAIGVPAVFYLRDGETVTLSNIPYGVTYTVVEDDYTDDRYDEAAYDFSDAEKTVDSAQDTVNITNNKGVEVDTGIGLDSLPYLLMLTIAMAGVAVYFKKRTAKENG
ncbi:MAG: hypothetical protein IJP30_06245 [Clostridia bacterium]|nr:hypothetical protein [Clostridia bacterium]